MGKEPFIKISVQAFQNEVNRLASRYLKSEFIKSVNPLFPSDKYDFENVVYGLWYYFAIIELSSKTGYTIMAYEDGYLSLEQILEGKILLLQDWGEDILFEEFNNFINEQIKWKKARQRLLVQTSLESFSVDGRDWLLKLHNDEKIKIYERLLALETVTELDKKGYIQKINELEIENGKKPLEFAIDTVKIDPQKYHNLVIRYEQIAQTDPKFIKNNGEINYAAITRYIRKICLYKIKERTIAQDLYRFREKRRNILK